MRKGKEGERGTKTGLDTVDAGEDVDAVGAESGEHRHVEVVEGTCFE